MKNNKEETARVLRHCRTKAGLTQAQLGALAGIKASTIGRYEAYYAEPVYSKMVGLLGLCGYQVTAIKKGKTFIDLDDLKKWKAERVASGRCNYDDMEALSAFISRYENGARMKGADDE